VVATAYLLGVSTRRVEKLAESLGVTQLSKSQVSAMARHLDEQVAAFRNRPLDAGPYTFVWVDALTQKVREGGRIINVHALIAVGVNADGHREILGLDVATAEDGAGWLAFLRVDELIASVLGHYERLWPRIEELITTHATEDRGSKGLVLEGSALWPVRVARLRVPRAAAVWLTTDDSVVRARVHAAGCYEAATDEEQVLMDKFLARTEHYQTLMIDAIDRLGLDRIDAGGGESATELADTVLAAADAQTAVGRSASGR
jgi:hypothetical protein